MFVLIVYALPDGVVGLSTAGGAADRGSAVPQPCRPTAIGPAPRCSRSRPDARRSAGWSRSTTVGLTVQRGEIVGLIGPNGSGKTTVLNLISGALRAGRRRHPLAGQRRSRRLPRTASPVSASRARSSSCACSTA